MLDYDAEATYHPCKNGKRNVTFQWRQNLICDTNSSALPKPYTENCPLCQPGFYQKDECMPCPPGTFSIEANSTSCLKCPEGKYTPKMKKYIDLDSFPTELDRRCEPTKTEYIDYCGKKHSWIIARKMFTVLPSTPIGVSLIMKKQINITQEEGYMEMDYTSYSNIEGAESLKVNVDGNVYSSYCDNLL